MSGINKWKHKEIKPIVNESVDKKIENDDLEAYQEQQQYKRQLELDKIRAEENKKREQQQLEVERLKKRFWQTSLYL